MSLESRYQGKVADVAIISAFGRGTWLASELGARGYNVVCVDVSEQIGHKELADIEGPFGLLETSELLPSQKEALAAESEIVSMPQGFTLWLKRGPLECRSEMTQFQLRSMGISRSVEKYIRLQEPLPPNFYRFQSEIREWPFSVNWLSHFSHQFSASVFAENHIAMGVGERSLLFSPFSIRRLKGDFRERGWDFMHRSGVRVRANAAVRDLRLHRGKIDAIEIRDESSGVLRAKNFIWSLSSRETQKMPSSVSEKIFPFGPLREEWLWCRYRFAMSLKSSRAFLPKLPEYVVVLEDPFHPWAYQYLMVLRRPEDCLLDVWVRLPRTRDLEKDKREGWSALIEGKLAERMPHVQFKCVHEPGLTPIFSFPVFSRLRLKSYRMAEIDNIFYDGPEMGESLDYQGIAHKQKRILSLIDKNQPLKIDEHYGEAPV